MIDSSNSYVALGRDELEEPAVVASILVEEAKVKGDEPGTVDAGAEGVGQLVDQHQDIAVVPRKLDLRESQAIGCQGGTRGAAPTGADLGEPPSLWRFLSPNLAG